MSMYLHELRAPDGARTRARRVGRGTGSGKGKTSGRGQKGQHARGQGFRLGFEGGQMPLAQRLPKLPGFKNPFKTVYAAVNLTRLNRFQDGSSVTPETLAEAGLIDAGEPVKVLGAGKLRRRLTVTAHAASESARAAIEGQGGTLTVLEAERRVAATAPEAAPPAEAEAQPAAATGKDSE
jgi:large subunit ribosomal protein L15